MKKIALFYSLSALLLLSSCGEKTDSSGGSSSDKPKQDYSQAPDFNTKPTGGQERMLTMQVLKYTDGFSTAGNVPYINLENTLGKTYLGGKVATKTAESIQVMQDKNSDQGIAKQYYMSVVQNYDEQYMVTAHVVDDKLMYCTCRTPKGEAKDPAFSSLQMRGQNELEENAFLFNFEKKQWVALKNKENIPSVEVQKQMFADCQATAKAGIEFKKNSPNDERWAGDKLK